MRIKLYNNLLKSLLPAALLLCAVGCTDEVHTPSSTDTDWSNEPVTVRATTVTTGAATRAGGDAGPFEGENTPIRNRTMLFTYPSQPDGDMKSAYCVFDKDGIGYVYAGMDLKGEPLRWKEIRTGEKDYPDPAEDAVFLDNLINYPVGHKKWELPDGSGHNIDIDFFTRILTCKEQPESELPNHPGFGQNPETAFIKDDNFTYRFRQMIAPVGHKEADEVDIIWGKIAKPAPNKSLHFTLEHQMCAISFRFYTEDEKLDLATIQDVWLDKVNIWLEDNAVNSNYATNSLYSIFNRKAGSVYGRSDLYRETSTASGLYLVDADATDGRPTELEEPQTIDGRTYYATPMWIVPPFKWQGNELYKKLPKLSFKLSDGEVYSGILPEKLNYWKYNEGDKKWELIQNETLRFWKGHHISFKVRVTREGGAREILFEEITVEPFARQMDETPELKQSGIYSGEDLETLVKTYNDNSEQRDLRLIRYGRYDTGAEKWIFPLWQTIRILDGQQLPKFKDDKFEFDQQTASEGIYQGDKPLKKEDFLANP